jgi:hypothetical protein
VSGLKTLCQFLRLLVTEELVMLLDELFSVLALDHNSTTESENLVALLDGAL